MRKLGLVSNIIDDEIEISVMQSEACGKCSIKSSCNMQQKKEIKIKSKNTVNAKVNDMVWLETKDADLFKGMMLLFILPLVLYLLTFFILKVVLNDLTDTMLILLSFFSFIPSFILIRIISKFVKSEIVVTGKLEA